MKTTKLTPSFVESIPELIEDGVLYVSMNFATAMHRCACGCGEEVVTPLSPTDWQLFFDGENLSLQPSIGNWGLPCRSHYWVRGGSIRWSGSMSDTDIEQGRAQDARKKLRFYKERQSNSHVLPEIIANDEPAVARKAKRFARFKRWIGFSKK